MTTIVVKFHCPFISLACGHRPVLLMPSDQVTEAVVKFYHCPDNVDVGWGWVTGDVVWYPPIISMGAPSSLIGQHSPALPSYWLILSTLHPFPECPPHAWVGYWVITQHRRREIVVIAVTRSHDSDDDITHSLTQWIPFTWILEQTGGDQPNKNNWTAEIHADSGGYKVAKLDV